MYKPPLRRESRPAVGGQHKTNLTGFSDFFFFFNLTCLLLVHYGFQFAFLGVLFMCVCVGMKGGFLCFSTIFFSGLVVGFFFLICLFHKERKRRCGIGWVGRLGGSGRGGGGETVI